MNTDEEVIQTVDKFQLIRGYPPAAPGKCINCGAFSGEFIDFGFSIDYYGAVYFCRSCFTSGCHLFGFHSETKMVALAKELGDAQAEVLRLNIENGELRSALAATDLVSGVINSLRPSDVPTVEDIQPEREEPAPVNKPDSGRKERSSKSRNESGSASVHDDDSSLEDVIGSI